MNKSIIFLAILVYSFQKLQLDAQKVVFALDCGSTQRKSSEQNFFYEEDQGFSENTKVADYSLNDEVKNVEIKYTNDPFVYMTERHAESSFQYNIPVKQHGFYVLILKFSEMYFNQPGQRVFNINLGSQTVVRNLDIFSKAGIYTAYDEYIEFQFKDNNIYFNDRYIEDAIVDNKLVLNFEKIGKDNPKVDGIVLFKGTLQESDYDSIAERKQIWINKNMREQEQLEIKRQKEQNAKMKKKEKIKIRNDHYEEFEDEIEEFDEQILENNSNSKNITIGIIAFLGCIFGFLKSQFKK